MRPAYCECSFPIWRKQFDVNNRERNCCQRCRKYQEPDAAVEDAAVEDRAAHAHYSKKDHDA